MIAVMKKLTAAIADHDVDALTKELVFLSALEVRDFPDETLSEGIVRTDAHEALAALEKQKSGVVTAIDTLSSIGSKKHRPLFASYSKADFEALADELPAALSVADKTLAANNDTTALQNELNRIDAELAARRPFEKLDEPLGLNGTANTAIFKGTFPKLTKMPTVYAALDETGIAYELCELSVQGDYQYVYAVVHRADADEFLRAMNGVGFSSLTFDESCGTAVEDIAALNAKRHETEEELEAVAKKYPRYAESLPMLERSCDYLESLIERERVKDKLAATDTVRLLTGYVPEVKVERLKEVLDAFDCAYSIEDVREDEKPPVFLINNRFSSPFESVISLYSYPDYRSVDPTAVMSIFYFIIFGLVMQDVGYGLLLLIGCPLLHKFMHPPKDGMMDKLLRMFTLCGISTVICGVLFGGYFGDLPSAVATKIFGVENFPELAVLFNPVKSPVTYLIISLALGAVHLISGMCMKAYLLIKRGQVLDAIFDVGIWFVVFAGFALLFLVPPVGKWVLIAGLAGLILTQGRAEKNPIMKLFKGVASLYDIISYASDLLSYSRIMALGMSGAIIGQVVNNIGTLGGPSFGGIIVLIIAFIIGHLLNLFLSLLSAFVHTARLQYIEFLGKFYEDGGDVFKPAAVHTKYSVIREQTKQAK